MPENNVFRLAVQKTKEPIKSPQDDLTSVNARAVLGLNTEMQPITPEQPSQIEYKELKDF